MTSARDEVLQYGLVDWIPLDDVHYFVAQSRPGASDEEVQSHVLQLIEALATEGLVALGNVNRESRFVPWDIPIAEAMQRLQDVYVDGSADKNNWSWFCWLALTDNGIQMAESIEATLQNDQQ